MALPEAAFSAPLMILALSLAAGNPTLQREGVPGIYGSVLDPKHSLLQVRSRHEVLSCQ